MSANISDVSSIEELVEDSDAGRVVTVMVAYDELKDDDRQLLDQFVQDQKYWSKEVHGDG